MELSDLVRPLGLSSRTSHDFVRAGNAVVLAWRIRDTCARPRPLRLDTAGSVAHSPMTFVLPSEFSSSRRENQSIENGLVKAAALVRPLPGNPFAS